MQCLCTHSAKSAGFSEFYYWILRETSVVLLLLGNTKFEKGFFMRGLIWLAGIAGGLALTQTIQATTMPYTVQATRGLATSTEKARGAAATSSATKKSTDATPTVTPLLSSIVNNPNGVETTTLVTKNGFTPESLDRRGSTHPSAPAPTPTPRPATGSKSVPDAGATATMLCLGALGTVLMKRKLAR
jgi:hypothetical protein